MVDSGSLKIKIIAVVLSLSCVLFFGGIARSNECYLCNIPFWYWLSGSSFNMPKPLLLIYLDSMCHDTYNLYFNSIGFHDLLGHSSYSPLLSQISSKLYNLLGIPTYPYLGFQYRTTFPYTPLGNTKIPYARFDYPAYVYGAPDFYLNWVMLQ